MAHLRLLILAAAALSVAACDLMDGLGGRPSSQPGGSQDPGFLPPQVSAVPAAPSPDSGALRLRYRQLATAQRANGLLLDGSGVDRAQSNLGAIFKALAFQDEFADAPRPLQRWETQLRVGMRFGPSVTQADRRRINRQVDKVLSRISTLTGIDAARDQYHASLQIYVVNDGERRAIPTAPDGLVTGDLSPVEQKLVRQMRPTDQCIVVTHDQDNIRNRGFVIIREELPAILQLACIEEELTQALGLTNDSPLADPSIFNDDDTYATLTGLDGRLLQLLYHPALRPGMALAQAGPIIDRITATLPQEGA